MLKRRCGACHDGARPSAKKAALAVFDLAKPGWSAGLTAARWQVAAERLEGTASTAEERALLARFAAARRR